MYDKLEQLELKQEKIIGIQKHAGTIRNSMKNKPLMSDITKTSRVENKFLH